MNTQKTAQIAFVWMFIGLSFFLGTLNGYYSSDKPLMLATALVPFMVMTMLGSIIGFVNVFMESD